jgi:hypothetical protein
MWNGCAVFNSKSDALMHAASIDENNEYDTEYGISFIRIDRVF